jgi:DNA repair exonuclease SbcCD ATPase subunit
MTFDTTGYVRRIQDLEKEKEDIRERLGRKIDDRDKTIERLKKELSRARIDKAVLDHHAKVIRERDMELEALSERIEQLTQPPRVSPIDRSIEKQQLAEFKKKHLEAQRQEQQERVKKVAQERVPQTIESIMRAVKDVNLALVDLHDQLYKWFPGMGLVEDEDDSDWDHDHLHYNPRGLDYPDE